MRAKLYITTAAQKDLLNLDIQWFFEVPTIDKDFGNFLELGVITHILICIELSNLGIVAIPSIRRPDTSDLLLMVL